MIYVLHMIVVTGNQPILTEPFWVGQIVGPIGTPECCMC